MFSRKKKNSENSAIDGESNAESNQEREVAEADKPSERNTQKPADRRRSLFYIISRRGKNVQKGGCTEDRRDQDKIDTSVTRSDPISDKKPETTCHSNKSSLSKRDVKDPFPSVSGLYPKLELVPFRGENSGLNSSFSIETTSRGLDVNNIAMEPYPGDKLNENNLALTPYVGNKSNKTSLNMKPYTLDCVNEMDGSRNGKDKPTDNQICVMKSNSNLGDMGCDIAKWLQNEVLDRTAAMGTEGPGSNVSEEMVTIGGKPRKVRTVAIYKEKNQKDDDHRYQ